MGTGSGIGTRDDARGPVGARRRAAAFAIMCALVLIALLGAAGVAGASPVGGARIWIGATDTTWTTAANWSGNIAPAAGNDLVFPAVATRYTTLNNFVGTEFRSLTFEATGYTFGGNTVFLKAGGVNATYASGMQTVALALGLTGPQAFVVTNAPATLEWTGEISGSGTLTKTGAGALSLTRNNAGYDGTVTVNGGTLDIGDSDALGSGAVTVTSGSLRFRDTLAVANPITINGTGVESGGALQNTYGGRSVLSGTLTLGSDATIGVTSGTLELQSIADSANVLTKSGDSPMVISGAQPYAGAINVAAGPLEVSGTLPATCDIFVLGGASAGSNVLIGTGATGPVHVASGGAVAPGATDPGRLTTAGITMDVPGAAFGVRVNGTGAGSSYDQLRSTGDVTLGATLGVTLGYTPVIGDSYTIIDKTGAGAVTGTFDGLAEGSYLTAGGHTFQITYTGGDGNDVVLTCKHAPTTFTISAGDAQSALPDTAFGTALQVRLLDENADPLPGRSVTFTAPVSGPGGTFAGSSTVTTDADGYATAPAFTANGTLGDFHVTASTANCTDLSFSLAVASDVPPVTTVHGVPSGWSPRPVRLTFSAEAPSGGAPVAYTEYRVGSGDWERGDTVKIRAQGATVVSYRSASTGGAVEETRTCTVRIDSVAPVVKCYGHPASVLGGVTTFRFRVADAAVGKVRAKLVITRYGHLVRSYRLGEVRANERLRVLIRTGLGTGTWNWRVVAYDPAGGRAAGKYRHLEVSPR